MNNQQQTPLEKLISDRRRIQEECAIQEQKLNADYTYIQENAGSLLLDGISAILFPKNSNKLKESTNQSASPSTNQPGVSIGLGDYLSIAQGLLPVAWDVVRPLLTAWGIQKAQRWIIKKLFKKKQ